MAISEKNPIADTAVLKNMSDMGIVFDTRDENINFDHLYEKARIRVIHDEELAHMQEQIDINLAEYE